MTVLFDADAERWEAVIRRDPAADGVFFYSVATTGVFCRPSCGARQARREHVAFHQSAAEAERAGFRPCRRCRPSDAPLAERHAALVVEACRAIDAAEDAPELGALAAAASMSRFHFHRVFKHVTGLTPRAYAAARRAERVRRALPQSASVTAAVYAAGFESSARFYAAAPELLGMSPSSYRRGGAGERIGFAAGECALGAIVVAGTDRGVCAIFLGDDPDRLVGELQERFPRAELAPGGPAFEQWVARVIGFVDAPGAGLDLPLDVRGTAFQQRVWRALMEIPAGSTASYTEIAARLGMPQSARAVARACAANPVAVAIPCHRIVRRDGGLSGYRWGVERKRALLAREADRSARRPAGDSGAGVVRVRRP